MKEAKARIRVRDETNESFTTASGRGLVGRLESLSLKSLTS
jgi:hypothetical protein